jgi:hypothetical protein
MKVSGYIHAPAALPPGKNTGIQLTGGWVGPSARCFEAEKTLVPLLRFETRTVQCSP